MSQRRTRATASSARSFGVAMLSGAADGEAVVTSVVLLAEIDRNLPACAAWGSPPHVQYPAVRY
ncbi:hypothetical protein GCM10009596_17040 [Arthrobacter rhombi]